MPIDTSMYNQMPTNSDPLTEAANAIKLRNALGNVNKIQGGSPTVQAVNDMGAGTPYVPPYLTPLQSGN